MNQSIINLHTQSKYLSMKPEILGGGTFVVSPGHPVNELELRYLNSFHP